MFACVSAGREDATSPGISCQAVCVTSTQAVKGDELEEAGATCRQWEGAEVRKLGLLLYGAGPDES